MDGPLVRKQMRLGYFDPDKNPYSNFSKSLVSSSAHKDLAYSAAVQSIVLLKNSPSSRRFESMSV